MPSNLTELLVVVGLVVGLGAWCADQVRSGGAAAQHQAERGAAKLSSIVQRIGGDE